MSFPTEEEELGGDLGASSLAKGVVPLRSVVLASELAGDARAGLAWGVVPLGRKPGMGLAILLAGALQSCGLVLQSGLAPGGGSSQTVSLCAVPWNLTTFPGGQTEWGKQRAQELTADVPQNMPARHSHRPEEFHEHGFFSTR